MEYDDSQLAIVADEIDIVLQGLSIKHKMPPLAVCAVVIARMMHFSKLSESQDDLGQLLLSVGESIENKEFDKPEKLH